MWLSGMSTPDHNTINRFRSDRLKEVLRQVFTQVVIMLNEQGLLNIKELYTDGTKIEASANRYTFVWGNAIKTSKERITKQLGELWQYAQSIAAAELPDTDPTDFKNKYEQQEKILNGRNSYSKTDPDASFMRMKEDHMLNGQLKPGYNLQVSSNNQYIVNYSLHQTTADTTTLQEHTELYKQHYNTTPQVVTADAGYGSEENYQYLAQNNIENYVKYNYFDKQQSGKADKKYPFKSDTLFYNEQKDCYICPMGQPMQNIGTHQTKSKTGFTQTITKYQAPNCNGCPLRGVCHKAKGNRVIEVNHALRKYKHEVKQNLNSDIGIYHRKKRCADVEPVFANIKNNHGFKRFRLRGKEKVEIETALLALAHNLRKKARNNSKKAA
jgi:endonuclease III